MNEERQRRLAANETLFREVNEQIETLNAATDPPTERGVFLCECSRLGCAERIDMTFAAYAAVRSNPRWFVVLPSDEHVGPVEMERVVAHTDHYFIVEKLDLAGEIAEIAAQH
jgi:hypothetical protein